VQPHTDSDSHTHVDKGDMWDLSHVVFYCHLISTHTNTQHYTLLIASREIH
jgi:hypothetical protein